MTVSKAALYQWMDGVMRVADLCFNDGNSLITYGILENHRELCPLTVARSNKTLEVLRAGVPQVKCVTRYLNDFIL